MALVQGSIFKIAGIVLQTIPKYSSSRKDSENI